MSYFLDPYRFALTLHYLPNDNRVHKYTAVAIYITFLLISVIPEFIDIIAGDPHDTSSDRELLLAWFIIPHITFEPCCDIGDFHIFYYPDSSQFRRGFPLFKFSYTGHSSYNFRSSRHIVAFTGFMALGQNSCIL